MTRRATALTALAMIGALLAFDLGATAPNPYRAPPLIALGSGAMPDGAHCAALPM